MKKAFIIIFLIFFSVKMFGAMVEISNRYIKLGVDQDSGRFTMSTIEGDPDNPLDDNMSILYSQLPLTSFTTFFIDGANYIFGSTEKDAYTIKKPMVERDKIVTVWSVKNIEISQEIFIVNGQVSGLPDTMNILYRVINRSGRPANIGTRIVLDPALNNAEPRSFVIPDKGSIIRETVFSGGDIPQYWYAFDNYDNPAIRVQGSLEGATKPSELVFASWERFYDNKWDFSVDSSRELKREGTSQYDSSAALYYGPAALDRDFTNEITAKYGLFAATPVTGRGLTLSLAVPRQTSVLPVSVYADFLNSGRNPLDKVDLELTVPQNFMLTQGENNITELQNVGVNESRKVKWDLTGPGTAGDYKVKVKATGTVIGTRTVQGTKSSVEAEKEFSFILAAVLTNGPAGTNLTAQTNLQGLSTNTVIITNYVTNYTGAAATGTNAVSRPVTAGERLILKEINDLDSLINSVNNKYEILMGIYKNNYATNNTFIKDTDGDIEKFEEELSVEEESLTNESMILRD